MTRRDLFTRMFGLAAVVGVESMLGLYPAPQITITVGFINQRNSYRWQSLDDGVCE